MNMLATVVVIGIPVAACIMIAMWAAYERGHRHGMEAVEQALIPALERLAAAVGDRGDHRE